MISLSEVITQLRAEISEALSASRYEELRFEPGPVELELTVRVEQVSGGKAGVRFWVIEASDSERGDAAGLQRIRLTLQPREASAKGYGSIWSDAEVAR